MRAMFVSLMLLTIVTTASAQAKAKKASSKSKAVCSADCEAKSKVTGLSCKLTSPELQQRKQTVIASLKKQVLSKKELKNGYAFRFSGSDEVVDELIAFIKTERACCDFFVFNLSISGDKSEVWMEITGPKGAKEFITTEMTM